MQYLQPRGAGVRFQNAFTRCDFSLIRVRSLSSRLFKVTVHFIQGLFGLSEPFKAKFIEEINR